VPAGVRILITGSDSALVSWLEPLHHNGQLLKYTVYWREVDNNRSKTSITIPKSLRAFGSSTSSALSVGLAGSVSSSPGLGSSGPTGNAHSGSALLTSGLSTSPALGQPTSGKYFYIVKNGGRRRYRKLPEPQPQYKLSALRSNVEYQLWLSASTRRGEGSSTAMQYFRPRQPSPPQILEFSQSIALKPTDLDGQLPLLLTCNAFSTQPVNRKWTRYVLACLQRLNK
jgi:hypothetical protein